MYVHRRMRSIRKTTTAIVSTLHLCIVLVWTTGMPWSSTTPPSPHYQQHKIPPSIHHDKIECLWCHHLERSRESCSTAELSFKRLHPASRWAPACCQCPMKWLVTAARDALREGFRHLHKTCIWHACTHRHAGTHLWKVKTHTMICYNHTFDYC